MRYRFANVVIFHEGVPHEREMKAQLRRLCPPSVRQIFVTMRAGLPDSYDRDSGVLYVSGSESRTPLDVQSHIPGVLHKSIVAMRHCLDTLEFDFLVRSNISTVIDFGRLPVDELPRGVAYGSTCVWHSGEPRAFASGTNIILSRAATELLVSRSAELDMTTIDDVAIGAFFARAGVAATQLSSAMVWDTDDERGVVFRNRDFSDETRAADVRRMGQIVDRLLKRDAGGLIESSVCELSKPPALGFVILRHVNSELTAKYWVLCYDSIRRVYPDEPILIVDDNSDPAYIYAHPTTNATVVRSEYPQRGDLLPYLYYLTHKISDRVVIINDSAFITREVPFCVERPYQHIWDFEHDWDQEQDEASMVGALDTDGSLRALHADKGRWKGCFGSMAVITHEYLTKVDSRYGLAKLTGLVTSRFHRMSFERVLACLLRSLCDCAPPAVYGDIHAYCPWGIKFDEGMMRYAHLPVIRVWTGR